MSNTAINEPHQTSFANYFGTITDRKISLNYKSGVEVISINQVTSVSFQRKRNLFLAITALTVAFVFLALIFIQNNNSTAEVIIYLLLFVLLLLSGIANWLGHHIILISVAGQNRKPLRVEMSKTKEGLLFVKTIQKSIL